MKKSNSKKTAQQGAYERGAEAARKRVPKKSCPYKSEGKGCSFWKAWMAGYDSARKK